MSKVDEILAQSRGKRARAGCVTCGAETSATVAVIIRGHHNGPSVTRSAALCDEHAGSAWVEATAVIDRWRNRAESDVWLEQLGLQPLADIKDRIRAARDDRKSFEP